MRNEISGELKKISEMDYNYCISLIKEEGFEAYYYKTAYTSINFIFELFTSFPDLRNSSVQFYNFSKSQ
jgi:hypothetical protein